MTIYYISLWAEDKFGSQTLVRDGYIEAADEETARKEAIRVWWEDELDADHVPHTRVEVEEETRR